MRKDGIEITEEHLLFLDDLRNSGIVNMYGAAPHLMEQFPELTQDDAHNILLHWMDTFSERNEQ